MDWTRKIAGVFLAVVLVQAGLGQSFRTEGSWLIVNETKTVQFRLVNQAKAAAAALAINPNASTVVVKHSKRSSRLLVNGNLICKLAVADAKSAGQALKALASGYAQKIEKALRLPDIVLSPRALRIPIRQNTKVFVTGRKAHKAIFSSDSINATRISGGFSLKAESPGTAVATIGFGKSVEKLSIVALPYAAALPQNLTAEVVGFPAKAHAVLSAIQTAVSHELVSVPGTKVSVGDFLPASINNGKARTFSVPISATALNAFPTSGIVTVTVKNLGELRVREEELWYCNNPEIVAFEQPLYRGTIRANSPIRLLYHHINKSKTPLAITCTLANRSAQPARVVLLHGEGKPNRDPVRTGLEAGAEFLNNWETGSGEVLTIPAGSQLPIAARRLFPSQTASGICYLRLLDSGPESVELSVEALNPLRLPPSWLIAGGESPWRLSLAAPIGANAAIPVKANEHVYPRPFKEVAARYEVGGRFEFVRLGQVPIANTNDTKHLEGNFGVIYTVDLALENPTTKSAKVEVVFETSAGYSAACFWIDNKFVATPVLQEKGEYLLRRETLAPGHSKRIRIRTIPLSGSSYPATITVRPIGG